MAGYIGSKASVVSNGAERKKVFDITATTTSLTGCSYTPNQVHVFHNGVRLVDGTDYTATDGSTVTLTTAAQSGDEVVVISYATFQTSDTVSASAGGTFTGDVTFSGAFTSRGIDDNADAVAMTIDSSENVLVGKTSSSGDVVGHRLSPDGRLLSTVDGNYVAQFNRKTSDGSIAEFRKDGTAVGNIGAATASGVTSIYAGNDDTALWFRNGIDAVTPFSISGNTTRDAAINIGQSGGRFKNLYLSGGVYLGGTGAANYLDDYEEGSWTPTVTASVSNPSVTYSQNTGYYTKVGNLVCVTCYLELSSFSGGSGVVYVSGLPFTSTNQVSSLSSIQNEYQYIVMPGDANTIFTRLNGNSTNFQFEFIDTRAGATVVNRGALNVGGVGSQFRLIASYTYRTNP